MENDKALRDRLIYSLQGKGAHVNFDQAVKNLPKELRGKRVPNGPYTTWQLVEHLRRTQFDILDFSRNPNYKELEWPKDYWPEEDAPPDDAAWENSIKAFQRDLQELQDLVADPKNDLFAKIPHGDGQTLLREAILVIDHNAYHIGELVLLRKLMGAWPVK